MRSGNHFKKSSIWVQSRPSSSMRLEIRAIWRLLVIFENWEMNRDFFLCHASFQTCDCQDIKKHDWTNQWMKKVQGLLTQFTNIYPLKEFLDQEYVRDNLLQQKDWHIIAYRVFNYNWSILNWWCASHSQYNDFFLFSSCNILFDVFCIKISRVFIKYFVWYDNFK